MSCAHAPLSAHAIIATVHMLVRFLIASSRHHQCVARLENDVLFRMISLDHFLVVKRKLDLLAVLSRRLRKAEQRAYD